MLILGGLVLATTNRERQILSEDVLEKQFNFKGTTYSLRSRPPREMFISNVP